MVVGLAPGRTRYRLTLAGIPTFVRCGADILLTALHHDLEAEARCPVCERPIQLEVRGRRIKDLQPPEAVLHVVEGWGGSRAIYVECEGTHLFDRRECLDRWRRTHLRWHGAVFTPQAYLDLWLRRQEASGLARERLEDARQAQRKH